MGVCTNYVKCWTISHWIVLSLFKVLWADGRKSWIKEANLPIKVRERVSKKLSYMYSAQHHNDGLVRIGLNGNFWKMKIWHQVNRVLPLKSKMKCVSFVIKKPTTSAFHQLFWILCKLVRLLVGRFWAWYWTSKIHIAAYFLDGTSYSKTYWQPCNYIQLFSLWW